MKLGGPALSWAFSHRYGDFEWLGRFLQDIQTLHIRNDFVSVHYYGNIGSLAGEYTGTYPSLTQMLRDATAARDRFRPGTPIVFSEWGPTYQMTANQGPLLNDSNIGASWAATFLFTLLKEGINQPALLLATTDLAMPDPKGVLQDQPGWPSTFLNPQVSGPADRKPIGDVLWMLSRLRGERINAPALKGPTYCFASADSKARIITVMVWNYGYQISVDGASAGQETAQPLEIQLNLKSARSLLGTDRATVTRWTLTGKNAPTDEDIKSHHYAEFRNTTDNLRVIGRDALVRFSLPPSSVSLIAIYQAGSTPVW